MAPRIRRLYGLVSVSARAQLLATIAFLVFERLFLAAGAIGFVRGSSLAWAATILVVALWGIRGLLRQNVSHEVRRRLTMVIAEAALANAGDGAFLPGSEAGAAVFEGRYVAEQILVRHVPSLVAEATAGLVLFFIIRPPGVPVLVSVATVAATVMVLTWMRGPTVNLQKSAWRQYMDVAERTLTSIRAASEIVASGHVWAFWNGSEAP